MSIEDQKKEAAQAALKFIEEKSVVGVGTGSTVNYFIDALAAMKYDIEGAVASSKATAERLKQHGITVIDPNTISIIPVYVDGADEVNNHLQMIKGGGGALTGEKIIAAMSQKFICITDARKLVQNLGEFPVAVEVLPIARSFVARELVKLGGDPAYREHFVSDYGNIILDVYNLPLTDPKSMEQTINQIPGVVCNGLFAVKAANTLLLASENGVQTVQRGV